MLLAVCDHYGIQSPWIPKIATGFCSGVARTGGLCGAYTGAVMGREPVFRPGNTEDIPGEKLPGP